MEMVNKASIAVKWHRKWIHFTNWNGWIRFTIYIYIKIAIQQSTAKQFNVVTKTLSLSNKF